MVTDKGKLESEIEMIRPSQGPCDPGLLRNKEDPLIQLHEKLLLNRFNHLKKEFDELSREEKLRMLNPSIMEFIRFKLSKLWNRN